VVLRMKLSGAHEDDMGRAFTRSGFPHLSLYLRACPEAPWSFGLPLRWASSCRFASMAASLQIIQL
jgi:hypothetical protein